MKAISTKQDQYEILTKITPLLHDGGQEQGIRSGTLVVHNIVGIGKAAEIADQHVNYHEPKGIVASEKKLHGFRLVPSRVSSPDSGRRNPSYVRWVMTPSVDAPDRCSVACI